MTGHTFVTGRTRRSMTFFFQMPHRCMQSTTARERERERETLRCAQYSPDSYSPDSLFPNRGIFVLDRLKRSIQVYTIMRRTLLHGLFPLVRAEMLRLLFTNARAELYVRQLARLSDLSLQTVQDELAKLEAARLVTSRSNGYHRFYRADSKHRLYATLRRLVVHAASHAKPQPRARGQRRGGRH